MIRLACFVALGLGILSFLVFVVSLLRTPNAGRGPTLESDTEGLAKLAEAAAKVIEAFTKAGPTLSALIASLFFVGVAAWLSVRVPPNKPSKPTLATDSSSVMRCVIDGYQDGHSDLPVPSRTSPTKDSTDCIDPIVKRMAQDKLLQILIIGRVDKRELRAKSSSLYGGNLGLAYQRAATAQDVLASAFKRDYARTRATNDPTPDEVAERIVLLPGGPRYVGPVSDAMALSRDRSAEIIALWLHSPTNVPDAAKTGNK